jgi:putative tricarboxylic transport membrane protein
MRFADLVTASFLALLGGLVVFDAVRLGTGWGTDGPQSGFVPFWLGALMVVASVAILFQAARRADGKPFVTRQQLEPVLKVLAPAVGFVALTPWLGLYVSAALYTGFYMRWIGRHRWLTVLAVGVLFPLATFLVFEKWFLVPMPKGPLEAWLGH